MKVVPVEKLFDTLLEFGGKAQLAEDIVYLTPSRLRVRFAGKGLEVSFAHAGRISALGIDFVFLKDPACPKDIPLVIDGDTRVALVSLVEDLRLRCAQVLEIYFSNYGKKLDYLFRDVWQRYCGLDFSILQKYRKIMQDFVYLVRANYTQKRVSPLPLPYTLSTFRSSHSINVALISGIIGLHYGEFNAERLFHLVSGALLEDVGFVDVAWEMKSPLWQEVYFKHPRIGCMIVNETDMLSPQMGIIVLEHHRYVNNSGYPDDIPEKDFYGYPRHMHLYSKIVSVAEAFDVLRCFYPAQRVINVLKRFSGILFDTKAVEILSNYIPLYYLGERVKLRDGREAIVMELDGKFGYKVCVVRDKEGQRIESGYELVVEDADEILGSFGVDVKLKEKVLPLVHSEIIGALNEEEV